MSEVSSVIAEHSRVAPQQLVQATLCRCSAAGEAIHISPVGPDTLKPVASKRWWSVGLHNESLAVVVLAVVLEVNRDDPKQFDAFTALLLRFQACADLEIKTVPRHFCAC